MTKDILLQTGYFIDNEYLDKYLKFIEQQFALTLYYEYHHIIPVEYYKIVYGCKNRLEAAKLANLDKNNSKKALPFR